MNLNYLTIKEIDEIDDRADKMLAAAVMYAEAGYYVIPIRPNEKAIPKKSTGLSYNHSSKNPEKVKEWYSGKYRGWNIGLACGAKDGIFVLDIDNGKDKNGYEVLADIERDHGKLQTLCQKTPSGGKHYVFRWFDNGRSSTSKIGKGIDTRGGDGKCRSHIVAWPSEIDGNKYEWEEFGHPEDPPDFLTEILGVPWNSPEAEGRGSEEVSDEDVERQYSKSEIWNMLGHIDPDDLDYDMWLQIGQAIHSQHPDEGIKLWDKWSRKGARYEEGECYKRWDGFKSYGPVRIGTLIWVAKNHGYVPKPNVEDVDFSDQSDYEKLIAEMNKEWGIAVVGGKIRVIGKNLNADPEKDMTMLTLDDFKALTMNKKIAITGRNGEVKPIPKSHIWLADEGRKEYTGGVEFRPDKEQEFEGPVGLTYNQWRGWKVTPRKGNWSRLKEHIRDVVCSGNKDHYEWVLDWMADMYQDPANPKGCALVMKGPEGCGKGTLMEAMGRTIGRHYKHLTQERHLTGNFNAHMQDALLVFADEVVYGGNKKDAGVLKALVTEPKLLVERKGLDAYSYRNCAHIGIASNEDWFIPAGPQSRRWFVLDVPGSKLGNVPWFKAIYQEMQSGGLEAMMYELLEREITNDLTRAPETQLLQDQRARYLDSHKDSIRSWWSGLLERESIGVLCYKSDEIESNAWPQLVSRIDLYEQYEQWCLTRKIPDFHISGKSSFYNRMALYGLSVVRPNEKEILARCGGKRVRMYSIPSIEECVTRFEAATGCKL